MWQDNWELIKEDKCLDGHSKISIVRNKETKECGILKRLKETDAKNSERRARMMREANSLALCVGQGVPRVLDHNTKEWEEKRVELYTVLEYVPGPTLAHFVSGKPQDLGIALAITKKLTGIVVRIHENDARHRDIKPDNVILRDGNPNDPYLIDFGLAVSIQDEVCEGDSFETEWGQDLGNRFLSVPELRAGEPPARYEATDVAYLCAILIYLLSGKSPRLLRDSRGRMPHQFLDADIPEAVKSAAEWRIVKRVLKIGLQYELVSRFQKAEDLLDLLSTVDEEQPDQDQYFKRLEAVEEELSEFYSDPIISINEKRIQAMRGSHGAFQVACDQTIGDAGLIGAGSGPNPERNGTAVVSNFSAHRRGSPNPDVKYTHITRYKDGKIKAHWTVAYTGAEDYYYEGPAEDHESLVETAAKAGKQCGLALLEAFLNKVRAEKRKAGH